MITWASTYHKKTNDLQCSILQSRVFTFVVGSSKKQYSIHEAAFSQLSDPLKVLLNGPLKEAQTMRVEWPDVDEQTFVRFTQWAYTKSYVTEEPDIILDQSSIELSWPTDDGCETNEEPLKPEDPGKAMYSLQSWQQTAPMNEDCSVCTSRDTNCYCRRDSVDRSTCCVTRLPKKSLLVEKFLDKYNKIYPTTTSIFEPRRNKESCED